MTLAKLILLSFLMALSLSIHSIPKLFLELLHAGRRGMIYLVIFEPWTHVQSLETKTAFLLRFLLHLFQKGLQEVATK